MATEAQLETARYLGLPDTSAEHIPRGVVEAVTATHLGIVPPEWIAQGFDALTDHDKEEVLKFARFIRAAGPIRPWNGGA